ncbi:MAG: hypothetical protein U1E45_21990 [Geminicoccaceae bacterium]
MTVSNQLLALLPNGEAMRPDEVRRVLIEPAAAFADEAGERFAVIVDLLDGTQRVIGTGLPRPDAVDLARRCARAVNEAAKVAP